MNLKLTSIFTALLMVTMSCVPNITLAQVQANQGCSAEALTGLIDPSTGRFITRDPLVGPLTLPHSQNPYAYAVSDPVNMSDPSGQAVPVLIPLLYYGGMACAALAPVAIGLIANTPLLDIAASQVEQGDYLGAVGTATMGMSVGSALFTPARESISITGYTRHGINQAISRDGGRGVAAEAILDAVRNPISVFEQSNGFKFLGKDSTVILNNAGKVISTWGENVPRNPGPYFPH